MPRADRLMLFCYDIANDKTRRKVAARLEDVAVRVQESVFEARMPAATALRLGEQLAERLASDDSLRIYAVGADGLRVSRAWGPVPMASAEEFWVI